MFGVIVNGGYTMKMKKICSRCNGTGTVRYFEALNANEKDYDKVELVKHYKDCPYCERGVIEIPIEEALDELVSLIDIFPQCLTDKSCITAYTAYKESLYSWVAYVKHMLEV